MSSNERTQKANVEKSEATLRCIIKPCAKKKKKEKKKKNKPKKL